MDGMKMAMKGDCVMLMSWDLYIQLCTILPQ